MYVLRTSSFVYCVFLLLGVQNKNVSDIPEIISRGVEKLLLRGTVSSSLKNAVKAISHVENAHEAMSVFCDSCKHIFDQTIKYRRSGANRDSMIRAFKTLCHTFTDWGEEVCDGYTDIEIDTVLFIIDNRMNLSGSRICAIEFQTRGCSDPTYEEWEIDLPDFDPESHQEVQRDVPEDSDEENTLKILHLTDFHYDPMYKPGSNSDCGKPLCCQESSGTPKNDTMAGYWGDYNACDMPWHSITQVVDEIKANYSDFDYIYYTGDIISHKSWATNKEFNTEAIKVLYDLFYDTFKPISIIPILGNHEPHPTDFYAPVSLHNPKVSTNWVFETAVREWSRWLPEETTETIMKGGFYTFMLKPGLRIVVLNSNVCYTSNLWLIYDDDDPYGQLQWLVDVLYKAEQKGEHVHILSHIPPGEPQCLIKWSENFAKIVGRFSQTIIAQFNGHTHLDELRFFFNHSDSVEVTNVAFNAGSFATYIGLNPNFRIYTVDSQSYRVLDYNHYIFNLTEANLHPNRNPIWFKLYSLKEAYDMDDTELKDFTDLYERMVKDEGLIRKYYWNKVKYSDPQIKSGCNDKCIVETLCSITAIESKSSINCEKYKKTHYKRRHMHARVH